MANFFGNPSLKTRASVLSDSLYRTVTVSPYLRLITHKNVVSKRGHDRSMIEMVLDLLTL